MKTDLKLNHLNLCSTDVFALSDLFSRYFDFELMQKDTVPPGTGKGLLQPGASFALLRGPDEFSLIISETRSDSQKNYPTGFHIGFTVSTPEEVYAKHAELCEGGCEPEPINTFEAMGKNWTAFYCSVGDDIQVEVNASTHL